MYNEECRKEIEFFFEKLNERRNNLPSELAIFNLLETFSYDRNVIGLPASAVQKELINTAFVACRANPNFTGRKMTRETRYELELIDRRNSDTVVTNYKNVEYQGIRVLLEKHKCISNDDVIWLHFSIVPENLKAVTEEIIRIVNQQSLSHYIKMPDVIGPDALIVGVYNKESAKILLEACKNNPIIQDSITLNNPFMPHCNGIGVIKETENRSYTRHISSLIHEYATVSKDKELTFKGFCRYVHKIFKECLSNRTYQERFLDYQTVLALFSIAENQDFLEHLIHLPALVYKKEEFDQYDITYENGEYCYTDRNGNSITSENFYAWLKLQAYNCIQRMCYEATGELPKEDAFLGERTIGYISTLIDTIMQSRPFQVSSNYRDSMINELYPYLVGYFAYEAKMATDEEIKNIISKVKRRMINKIKVDGTNKNFYQIEDKVIQSTIPPIRINDTLVGIEYLDYEVNYCNVFIYKDDKVIGYLGIFLDTDKEKIWEENDIESSTYRAKVARDLCNYDMLKKEHTTRGPLEGLLVHLSSDEYVPDESLDEKPKTIA